MKKVALISLIGPVLVLILRLIEIAKTFSVVGLNGNYQCALSADKLCSLFEYVFKGDDAVLTYIAIITTYISLFAITSYAFLLITLYKNKRYKLFSSLLVLIVVLIFVYPFVVNYITEVM